jgi:hypothetical protein
VLAYVLLENYATHKETSLKPPLFSFLARQKGEWVGDGLGTTAFFFLSSLFFVLYFENTDTHFTIYISLQYVGERAPFRYGLSLFLIEKHFIHIYTHILIYSCRVHVLEVMGSHWVTPMTGQSSFLEAEYVTG